MTREALDKSERSEIVFMVVEAAGGIKDPLKIKAFIEEVRSAEQLHSPA